MTTYYDEELFSQHESGKIPREQIGDLVRRYVSFTGKSHSLDWRKIYLGLEEETGFRPPEKAALDAIEKAGPMARLLEVAQSLLKTGSDHASELDNRIPEYTPHRSLERRLAYIERGMREMKLRNSLCGQRIVWAAIKTTCKTFWIKCSPMKSEILATYFITDRDAVAFPAVNSHCDQNRP